MNEIITNSFNIVLNKEGGYPRLYITHPNFTGRVKKRIGKNISVDDQFLIFQLKSDFESHFSGIEITKDAVKDYTNQYVSFRIKGNGSILDFYDEFIEFKKASHNKKTKKLLVSNTITAYETARDSFESFLKAKKISPLPSKIDKKLLDDFYYWLKVKHNTRVKLHGKIKGFMTFLIEEKNIPIDKSYKKSIFSQEYDNQDPEENDIALTVEEVKKLIELRKKIKNDTFEFPASKYSKKMESLQMKQFTLKVENLRKSLDCFLFMVSTGQYHSDIMKTKVQIKSNRNASYLSYRRAKNHSFCKAIPILNDEVFIAKEIIEEYKIRNGSNFPLNLSLTHFVKHLKEISKMAGFDFEINNRMARKTFASILYFSRNMPIQFLQIMLGHKNVKYTSHYLRIQDDDLADEIQEILRRNQ
jgi:site-specific recombinase XerD